MNIVNIMIVMTLSMVLSPASHSAEVARSNQLCQLLNFGRNDLAAAAAKVRSESNPLRREAIEKEYQAHEQQLFSSVRTFLETNPASDYSGTVSDLELIHYSGANGVLLAVDIQCGATISTRFLEVTQPGQARFDPNKDSDLSRWRSVLENLVKGDRVTLSGKFGFEYAGAQGNPADHYQLDGVVTAIQKGLKPLVYMPESVSPPQDHRSSSDDQAISAFQVAKRPSDAFVSICLSTNNDTDQIVRIAAKLGWQEQAQPRTVDPMPLFSNEVVKRWRFVVGETSVFLVVAHHTSRTTMRYTQDGNRYGATTCGLVYGPSPDEPDFRPHVLAAIRDMKPIPSNALRHPEGNQAEVYSRSGSDDGDMHVRVVDVIGAGGGRIVQAFAERYGGEASP